MNLGLKKFQRQFWKADSEYFPRVIISFLLIAVFGGEIVMKPPFLLFFLIFFDQCISLMDLGLEKILIQFWKADSKYFPMVIMSIPFIAAFGGERPF